MIHRQFKLGVFVLEGLNSFATTYYFYYFYFFMQIQFGFGDKANLVLAALNGFVCMIAAWWGGRFGQRAGYFTALKLGFGIMGVALLIGAQCAIAARTHRSHGRHGNWDEPHVGDARGAEGRIVAEWHEGKGALIKKVAQKLEVKR